MIKVAFGQSKPKSILLASITKVNWGVVNFNWCRCHKYFYQTYPNLIYVMNSEIIYLQDYPLLLLPVLCHVGKTGSDRVGPFF